MSALFVNGRMTLADAARTCRYRGNPRAVPPDLDALLILLRATLTGIDSARAPARHAAAQKPDVGRRRPIPQAEPEAPTAA